MSKRGTDSPPPAAGGEEKRGPPLSGCAEYSTMPRKEEKKEVSPPAGKKKKRENLNFHANCVRRKRSRPFLPSQEEKKRKEGDYHRAEEEGSRLFAILHEKRKKGRIWLVERGKNLNCSIVAKEGGKRSYAISIPTY